MTSLKTSIKTITYLSDTGCLEIQGASLRFFRSLKNEWMPVVGYVSFSEAAHAITDYIVGYYSALRPHEYNGGLPPNESENRYWKNSNSVASFC